MKSVMYAVNGDQTVAKPYGASEVYIVNGDTSVPKPAGVSEVYLANGDTSIPRPAGVSEVYADEGDLTIAKPDGVSVVSIANYSSEPPVPPTPTIPENTVRFKFSNSLFDPSSYTDPQAKSSLYWSLVDEDENVWDCRVESPDNKWGRLFNELGYNSGVSFTFEIVGSGTNECTDFYNMFVGKNNLTKIGDIYTDKAADVSFMFAGCTNVESGALALYEKLSAMETVPTHTATFASCGSNTTTGAAELAQIPSGWK